MSPRSIRGHDYTHGADVEMTPAQWRDLCSWAVYTRRVGTSLLVFTRDARRGRTVLSFEIYDDGALKLPRSIT